MERGASNGQGLVIAVVAALISTSALVAVVYYFERGSDRLPSQVVRFLLTVVLCVFLYRGANWARWVAGVLCGLSGVGSMFGGAMLLAGGKQGLPLLGLGVVYVTCFGALLLVPSVSAYFRRDRPPPA